MAKRSSASTAGVPSQAIRQAIAASRIKLTAKLLRPKATSAKPLDWCFLVLPKEASNQLPSRGPVSIEGTLNGRPFQATLLPDGAGSHWLKVDQALRAAAGASVNDTLVLEILPAVVEPEPVVPEALYKALATSSPKTQASWADITPLARRDWIYWIESAKQAATRDRRVKATCDMLEQGKRRPCCFDRSGMYEKSQRCPEAEENLE